MPRAIWSGSISFGLVNVPVRMYSAIDEQDVRFHLLHSKDERIGYEKICKKEGKLVPDSEIVKGYEVSEGEHVYVTDEDLEAAAGRDDRARERCSLPTRSGRRRGWSRAGRRSASRSSRWHSI